MPADSTTDASTRLFMNPRKALRASEQRSGNLRPRRSWSRSSLVMMFTSMGPGLTNSRSRSWSCRRASGSAVACMRS